MCRFNFREPQTYELFVTDSISKRCFLVDTGAQVSVTPASKLDKKNEPRGPPLQAANGSIITTYGTRFVCLRFGQRNFQARLIAADVSRPLLGADFLRTHNLLVDVRNRRLIEADTFSGIPCYVSAVALTNLAPVEPSSNKFRKLLNEFPDLLKPTFSTAEVKHGVHHFILTKNNPVFAQARHLAPDRLAIAKKEFSEMEKIGIIRKSSSRGHLLSIWYPNQMVATLVIFIILFLHSLIHVLSILHNPEYLTYRNHRFKEPHLPKKEKNKIKKINYDMA